MRGRGIDTPRLQIFSSKLFFKCMITPVIECAVSSLVLWCSGYHICFTRRRSPVRPWTGSDIFVTAFSRTKLQVSRLILDCIYYLQIVIYSAQQCHPKLALPHPKQYRGSCHQMSLLDTNQLCSLTHTWKGVAYIVPILIGTGSPV